MQVDISIGEVFNRITALDLKLVRINDTSRLDCINKVVKSAW